MSCRGKPHPLPFIPEITRQHTQCGAIRTNPAERLARLLGDRAHDLEYSLHYARRQVRELLIEAGVDRPGGPASAGDEGEGS